MATENQIQANRANALKSTGPVTPEGKRISSKNASKHGARHGSPVVLKGESIRRFNDLAAALTLQFQPRNSVEASLVQTMAAARWRMLRMWAIQATVFELETARLDSSLASEAVLATAFRRLADNSQSLTLQHRLEAAYDRQYHRADPLGAHEAKSPARLPSKPVPNPRPRRHPPDKCATSVLHRSETDPILCVRPAAGSTKRLPGPHVQDLERGIPAAFQPCGQTV